MALTGFSAVKVFSATKGNDREVLGEKVTAWLQTNDNKIEIVDTVITQSSDQAFHCLAITVFYNPYPGAARPSRLPAEPKRT